MRGSVQDQVYLDRAETVRSSSTLRSLKRTWGRLGRRTLERPREKTVTALTVRKMTRVLSSVMRFWTSLANAGILKAATMRQDASNHSPRL